MPIAYVAGARKKSTNNMTYLSNLVAGQFFSVDNYPGEWYQLVDDHGLNVGKHRFGVCVQSGIVRKFYLTSLINRVYLSISVNRGRK